MIRRRLDAAGDRGARSCSPLQSCASRSAHAALVLMLVVACGPAPCSAGTIRILCLNGLLHDYDLPNGIAAQVAAERVNNDSSILPGYALNLQLLDTTLVRTARTLSGVNDEDFDEIRSLAIRTPASADTRPFLMLRRALFALFSDRP